MCETNNVFFFFLPSSKSTFSHLLKTGRKDAKVARRIDYQMAKRCPR